MNILAMLRKLPIAKWIKPLWKGGLVQAAQKGGDALQAEFNGLLEREGDAALKKVQERVDRLQQRFAAMIDGLPFPAALEAQIKAAIDKPIDELQARLAAGCAHGCALKARAAFDVAFDRFQADVIARINAL